MANWDNHTTKLEQERITASIDDGVIDGDAVDAGTVFIGYPLPSLCYKPVYMLTPSERGFLLGVWLKQWLRG